jgi:hypothetical protein
MKIKDGLKYAVLLMRLLHIVIKDESILNALAAE